MTETATPPAAAPVDYRKLTDALAGALERLHEKQARVNDAQSKLSAAQQELHAAQEAAKEVESALKKHLADVLPAPNPHR